MNRQGDAKTWPPLLQSRTRPPTTLTLPRRRRNPRWNLELSTRSSPQLTPDLVKLHGVMGPDLENNFTGGENDASGKLSKPP